MSKVNEKLIDNSDDKFFFEGRIREIEQEIIDFQLDLARSNSQSESLQKIITPLIIHGKLTQSQIKKLANLSKSTISTGLSNLINNGHVKKEKIHGSREYKYFISSTYKESMYNALGSLDKDIQFLEKKLLDLTINFSSEDKGFNLLSNRIKEIIRVFRLYEKVLVKFEDDSIEINNKDIAPDLTIDDIVNIDIKFNLKIKQIEDEIIDFFLYSSAYSTMNELTMRIYTYFLTRNVLTQKKIRNLTGLSLGKVSQIINVLLELDVIEKLDKKKMRDIVPLNKMRQQIYSMNSIQKSFFRSGLVSGRKILESKVKFEKLKNELVANEPKLKLLNGYDKVSEVLDNYINFLSNFQKITQIFEEFI